MLCSVYTLLLLITRWPFTSVTYSVIHKGGSQNKWKLTLSPLSVFVCIGPYPPHPPCGVADVLYEWHHQLEIPHYCYNYYYFRFFISLVYFPRDHSVFSQVLQRPSEEERVGILRVTDFLAGWMPFLSADQQWRNTDNLENCRRLEFGSLLRKWLVTNVGGDAGSS